MKRIQKFKDYQKVEEGWKQNIVAIAALVGSYFAGNAQTKLQSDRDIITRDSTGKETMSHRLHDSSYINQFLSEGWKLTSVEVDTIWNEIKQKAPKTEVVVTRVKYDKNKFYQSGEWNISNDFKSDIDSIIDNLSISKDILIKVDVISSTDKQSLSNNLKNIISNLGFSPDNQGLSKARSSAVKKLLIDRGISDTIINTNNLYEQGEKMIDEESRYVYVDFYYLAKVENPGASPERTIRDLKKTYVMQTDITPTKPGNYKPEKEKNNIRLTIKLGPIFKHNNRGSVKCYHF